MNLTIQVINYLNKVKIIARVLYLSMSGYLASCSFIGIVQHLFKILYELQKQPHFFSIRCNQ